ncbi:Eukaryotic aspartyl protease family protein isoform 2 [Hibiscus syriacus]|uniref:Eukaryotic aspartyl protease family protein isoform 2 n=1 Tax=Hibiscus syriacus TaxID=106335 RepID=A0A6A2WEY3_HIBSY|nr:protein ASPARTIC PROTEASE IN GUARD CELL 1-like [Hibiscus syriacus]KAE8657063.1 Eukaryotic aspartyl protease family protein isoform 2 [Hibiscus syriacus]
MPRTWFFLTYFFLIVCYVTGFHISIVDARNNQRPPMVLPLRLSSRNHSLHRHVDNLRRHLQQSKLPRSTTNARTRLYDDLLSNGYHTTRLWIGSPPQEFALIVDTGSTVTYVPCFSCSHCGDHQGPRFQPDMSSTYQPVKCNPSCNCDDEKKQCTYDRRYAEMSSSSGVLGEDLVSFGNDSELAPQPAIFGCENMETGDLYSQRADGIMGLGRGRLSVVDQLVDKGVIGDSFSLCYGGMDVGGGAMVLGEISPPPDMVFSHSDPFRSPYYNIELKEIHVAGKQLNLPAGVFDGKHGTVLDSGTTYAYFRRDAFSAFRNAILSAIHFLERIPGPDPNYHDICFSGAGSDVSQLSKIFPEVEMVFKNGKKLLLSPENYLFKHTKASGAYCLGIFPNSEPTTLLGGIVVQNTLVTYDRANDRIGFLKTNCSELWRRLQFSVAPEPALLVSQSNDTNMEIPPVLSRSASTWNILSGPYHIGFITFGVSISTADSNLKHNLKELGKLISEELEVDDSQVRLLNVTSHGKDFIVRWGIFPVANANYISNTTALSIIMRLRGHRMQLPEKFGDYKLVEWNAEPQRELSWWQHHFLATLLGSVTTLILILSVICIWLVHQHHQQAAYEPVAVGASIPEQDLNPVKS